METITFEALAEELGLSVWWMSIVAEEAVLYWPIGEPYKALPEGKVFRDLSGEKWRSLPYTKAFAELCRERWAAWPKVITTSG